MPQSERDIVLQWKTEAPFLSLSENEMESTQVIKYQLDKCIGSSRYQICHENMATQMRHSSCLSTLYFKGTLEAMKGCETEKVFLPMREQPVNLGYGDWLLLSSNEGYPLIESYILKSENTGVRKWKRCRICIITIS